MRRNGRREALSFPAVLFHERTVLTFVIQGEGLDFRILHRVVGLHYIDEALVLNLSGGRLRNHDDILHGVGEDDVARRVAAQDVVVVGEQRAHAYRTRRRVDDATDGGHPSGVGVDAAVDELQLYGGQLVQNLLRRAAFAHHGEQLALSHGEVSKHFRVVGHGSHRRSHRGADETAYTVGYFAHDAVAGAGHLGILQVALGIHQRCLGLCQRSFGLCQLVFGGAQLVVAHDAALVQLAVVLCSQFLCLQGCLGGGHGGFCRLHGCLVLHLVDGEQYLSLLYYRTLVHMQLGDEPADHGSDFHVLLAPDGGGVAVLQIGGSGLCLDYCILRRGACSTVALPATAEQCQATCHQNQSTLHTLNFNHCLFIVFFIWQKKSPRLPQVRCPSSIEN